MVAFSLLSATLAGAALVAASPAARRDTNVQAPFGFPNPNMTQVQAIEDASRGKVPGGGPPPLANTSLAAIQLIRLNENFEVYYFQSLLDNITNGAPGYTVSDAEEKAVLQKIISTVVAQEEFHSLIAGNVLDAYKVFSPPPCTYKFPVSNLTAAIALASTFTDVVLGALQGATELLAMNQNAAAARIIGSIIGQEGEQNGYYRNYMNLVPSSKPLLTVTPADYAFSALQMFIVSCPFSLSQFPFTAFPPLMVTSGQMGMNVSAQDQTLSFSVDVASAPAAAPYVGKSGDGLYVTYINGQNTPVSEPVKNILWCGTTATFDADFPFADGVLWGLTLAGLTTNNNFTSADDVPAATLAAPGIIQVNDMN